MATNELIERAALKIHRSTKVKVPDHIKAQVLKNLNLPVKALAFVGDNSGYSRLRFWGSEDMSEQMPLGMVSLLQLPDDDNGMETLAEYLLLDNTLRAMEGQIDRLKPQGAARRTIRRAKSRLFLCRRQVENRLIDSGSCSPWERSWDDEVQDFLNEFGLDQQQD